MRDIILICICGNRNTINITGNNNANGKILCKCGRHITVHFRRTVKGR